MLSGPNLVHTLVDVESPSKYQIDNCKGDEEKNSDYKESIEEALIAPVEVAASSPFACLSRMFVHDKVYIIDSKFRQLSTAKICLNSPIME